MKEEFYDRAFRKKLYRSLDELQADVDIWIKSYNEIRPHSGKYCYGKTPEQTFLEGKKIAQQKTIGHKNEQPTSDNTETLSVAV